MIKSIVEQISRLQPISGTNISCSVSSAIYVSSVIYVCEIYKVICMDELVLLEPGEWPIAGYVQKCCREFDTMRTRVHLKRVHACVNSSRYHNLI